MPEDPSQEGSRGFLHACLWTPCRSTSTGPNSMAANSLVEMLNRQLKSTPRPSFIGPVEVTSLDIGSAPPEVEPVDLRCIHRDFVEDDGFESGGEPVKVTENAEDDDGSDSESVSRRAANHGEAALEYHHLPPHVRQNMFASTPSLRTTPDLWNGGMSSLPSLGPVYSAWPNSPMYRSPLAAPMSAPPLQRTPSRSSSLDSPSDPALGSTPAPADPNAPPNLQLHLHVHWPSDLRITLTTSLLINYPSPMFMSLSGERKRVHLCILDDMDPYGPSAGVHRPKRDSMDSMRSTGTTPDVDPDIMESPILSAYPRASNKPLPVGQRLLPSIYIESEIGQTDKHVLKNVTRVERFIQDVIRKTVEEELVFPNFHTLVMA
ncbi:hypothetical protein HMN09_00005100 [Mycena chlorophos]|uniref:SMP-LTD domain-containing protein n=1 Tax=Mycena chlorophos TaxID=658473 RepID=A0A8H6WLY5_MYCCL|nr:hypothetical protein HMN09_00005100 [Mycena chlorophos]